MAKAYAWLHSLTGSYRALLLSRCPSERGRRTVTTSRVVLSVQLGQCSRCFRDVLHFSSADRRHAVTRCLAALRKQRHKPSDEKTVQRETTHETRRTTVHRGFGLESHDERAEVVRALMSALAPGRQRSRRPGGDPLTVFSFSSNGGPFRYVLCPPCNDSNSALIASERFMHCCPDNAARTFAQRRHRAAIMAPRFRHTHRVVHLHDPSRQTSLRKHGHGR